MKQYFPNMKKQRGADFTIHGNLSVLRNRTSKKLDSIGFLFIRYTRLLPMKCRAHLLLGKVQSCLHGQANR